MQRLKRTILIGTLVTLFGASAIAVGQGSDPDSVFFSKKVLGGALADIARMGYPELHSFVRYLSECDGDREEHTCHAAYESYLIEFGTVHPGETRPLDDLVMARELRETLVRVGQKRSFDLKMLYDEERIISALEDAARARFRVLRDHGK